MHMIRRLHVTLLEVLIALSLVSFLLTSLLSTYRYINSVHQKITEAEEKNFQLLYVQNRLSRLFTHALSLPKDKKEREHFYFYSSDDEDGSKTKTPSLVFVYDNQATIPPSFSNAALARLYLDPKDRLCLAVWPSPANTQETDAPMHKEVLLEGVDNLRFEFYLPPHKEEHDNAVNTSPSNQRWWEFWPPDTYQWDEKDKPQDIPTIVKIRLTLKDKEEIPFAFLLPHAKNHILYTD